MVELEATSKRARSKAPRAAHGELQPNPETRIRKPPREWKPRSANDLQNADSAAYLRELLSPEDRTLVDRIEQAKTTFMTSERDDDLARLLKRLTTNAVIRRGSEQAMKPALDPEKVRATFYRRADVERDSRSSSSDDPVQRSD